MKSQEQLKEQHDFHEQSRDGLPVNVKLLTVVLIKAELELGLIVPLCQAH